MAITTYSELQSAVASWLHRTDLTTQIKDFIALAEADMQVRAKLAQWDATGSVTISSGSGALPSDHAHTVSARFGTQTGTLQFISWTHFADYVAANPTGEPLVFTLVGTDLHIAPAQDGTVTLNYTARFTPLSDAATSNSLLTLFPDAYLQGALAQACNWLRDTEGMATHGALFESAIGRIRKYMMDQKYPQGLQMRAV